MSINKCLYVAADVAIGRCMARKRVKLPADTGAWCYHCMTRCVQGRHLLDDTAKEILRLMMWRIADFCGVEVVTYAIMPNHFHVLVRVPEAHAIDDAELLRRYRLLHPPGHRWETARIEVITGWLRANTPEGRAWRSRQLALMNDISGFLRLLKQRFSIWYNATHNYFGTLWAERFKSVLVDHESEALLTMAAYIDLNAVRKGLVSDPKDYRFCGYAEALAGSRRARHGIAIVCPSHSWGRVLAHYRTLLYSCGASPKSKGNVIDQAAFSEVMAADGQLPVPTLLRHQWKHFTDGVILGSHAFVLGQQAKLFSPHTPPKNTSPTDAPTSPPSPSEPAPAAWGDWCTLFRPRFRRFRTGPDEASS